MLACITARGTMCEYWIHSVITGQMFYTFRDTIDGKAYKISVQSTDDDDDDDYKRENILLISGIKLPMQLLRNILKEF